MSSAGLPISRPQRAKPEKALIAPDENGWVNARSLHGALQVKTKFADWIKRRLTPRHVEGIYFRSVLKREKRAGGGNLSKEYFVSTRFAEHIAMMEDTQLAQNNFLAAVYCTHEAE